MSTSNGKEVAIEMPVEQPMEEEPQQLEEGVLHSEDGFCLDGVNLDDTEEREAAEAMEKLEKPAPVTVKYHLSYTVQIEATPDKKRICCKQKNVVDKVLLNRAIGEANPGDLVAIMGPSGAGKTSLLRVLACRVAKYTGRVLFNGKILSDSSSTLLCFVQQEDLFIPSMTPREHLIFSARLRIDRSVSDEDKLHRVNGLLAELGLHKCADTPIGGVGAMVKGRVSGGERKRLSLATEILSNPSVIFVDEPTSGLDSFMAEAVVAKLGRLARNGHTVLATIHQPSSYVFSAFNKLHLLADGRTAYSGSSEGAVDYFASIDKPLPPLVNPADYYLRLLSVQNESLEVLDVWDEGPLCKQLEMEGCDSDQADTRVSIKQVLQTKDFATSWTTQLNQLMKRTIVTYKRDATLGRIRMAQAVVLALLVGLIYVMLGKSPIKPQNAQSVNGVLFFAVLNQGMLGTLGVLQVFPLEKPVFLRESAANAYSPSAYFMGKTLAEGPFQIIFPTIFATIIYFLVGFGGSGAAVYFTFILFIVLTAVCAISLGYLVGAIVPDVGTALALGPLCLMPLIIFGGLLINVDDIDPWFVWLSYISFIRYGYEGVMIVIWEQEGVLGETVLEAFSWDVDHKWRNVGCLCALIVGFRGIAMIFLKMQSVDKTKLT